MKITIVVPGLRQHLENRGNGPIVPTVSLFDSIFTMKEHGKEEGIRYEERIRDTGLLVFDAWVLNITRNGDCRKSIPL